MTQKGMTTAKEVEQCPEGVFSYCWMLMLLEQILPAVVVAVGGGVNDGGGGDGAAAGDWDGSWKRPKRSCSLRRCRSRRRQ